MILHPVVRWLAGRAIRWFYRDMQLLNADAIPATGATLLVGSHGNDLPDILMTFLTTKRDVLFVANIAAADSPAVRWTFAGLGVIPVSRVRDARALKKRGEDASALNAQAFVRVVDALKAGHAVAIFPEGNVNDAPCMGPLRNGAAKMALQALESGVPSLTMVPIGYQYENPPQPRSGLLGVVGEPVELSEWQPVQSTKSVSELTQFIRDQLQLVTRNSRTQFDATALSTIAAATGAAISSAAETPLAATHRVQQRCARLSAADGVFVANSIAPSAIAVGELFEQFVHAANALSVECMKFGAHRWSARDHADVLCAAGDVNVSDNSPSAAMVWALAPLAAIAWAWHIIPVWACHAVAVKLKPRRVEFASRVIIPGLYIVELWYIAVPLLLLLLGVTKWLVLPLFVLQPWLGDFAFSWRDRVRALRLVARVRRATPANRAAVVAAGAALRASWLRLVQAA